MFAKVALTDILQTREIRQNSEYYVFLNDTNKENTKTPKIIRPEIQQMFKENNITTVLYSKRNEVLDQLKAYFSQTNNPSTPTLRQLRPQAGD